MRVTAANNLKAVQIRTTCEQHRATIEQWVRTKPYYQVLRLPMVQKLKRCVDEGMPIGAATIKLVSVRIVRVGVSILELQASCDETVISLGRYQL